MQSLQKTLSALAVKKCPGHCVITGGIACPHNDEINYTAKASVLYQKILWGNCVSIHLRTNSVDISILFLSKREKLFFLQFQHQRGKQAVGPGTPGAGKLGGIIFVDALMHKVQPRVRSACSRWPERTRG